MGIDFEEFCAGCMRLKGEARAFDVHVMLLQLRHFVDKWSNFTRFVAEQLGVAVCDEPLDPTFTTKHADAIGRLLSDEIEHSQFEIQNSSNLSDEVEHGEHDEDAKENCND